ncbi:MAG: chemotaxis protein CheW [Planctomycetes bacterium]|nr:chemotaxis protein CheW [Planctomycetota bacterium]
MDDVVKEFLVESQESLDQLDLDFLALEQDPSNAETLASVFRSIHTIKGTCGFLGFSKLERVTHVGETLLGKLRDGDLAVNADITSALLALGDCVREILNCIETAGDEGGKEYAELVETLTALQTPGAVAAIPALAVEPEAETTVDAVEAPSAADEPDAEAPVAKAKPRAGSESGEQGNESGGSIADTTVRIDVCLLNSLMNQVGELVLARNQILQFSTTQEDSGFLTTAQRLNLITTELQEGVMKTRMQAIGTVWNKFPRVVRDLSRMCGKKVRVDMDGQETELDRTIIEAIKDPLTHVVRNAVDHGIETPEDRRAAGKREEGTVWLRAYHEGGQVNIEIVDDGKGIDVERVKQKAIANNVISAARAESMGDREALNLIFSPGLSTAKEVTNISGRGVGMDVVKTNIERIGGTVDIQSEPGRGSTLRVKIPLTLAIIPAVVVSCSGDSFAIPQVSLLELVRLDGEQAQNAIEMIHDVPVYRLRGNLLPMVWLDEQLGLHTGAPRCASDLETLNIAVLQADERQFGLVVDEVNDNQEIVVKPLGKLLQGLTCFAGATIMGDGKVALILDALGLGERSGVVARSADIVDTSLDQQSDTNAHGDSETMLLFSIDDGRRMAVPLSKVARLEEFEQGKIERTGRHEVVQYRGEILPLVHLSRILGTSAASAESGSLPVIVYTEGDKSVGIVVDDILDIVDQRLAIESQIASPGVRGSAVIQGRVAEILDIEQVVEMAGIHLPRPEFAGS